MSGDSLAATLNRLNSCREAADLIYSKDAAHALAESDTTSPAAAAAVTTADDFSIVMARRIGTMVARLNDLASPASQVVLTPRMVLCELMDVVRQALYTSLPPSMQEAASPTDKAAVVRQFNTYASARQIPLEAAAEGLYIVSYVSVKLRVELVALQLRRRIQAELQKKDTQDSEGSVAALVVTETLLEDFMSIYHNIVLTLPITKATTTAAATASSPSEADAAAAERLVPVFQQYFYQLCDWVLVLESTMKGPVLSYTQVKRLSVDEQRGTVVVDLHRPTPQTAWGLLLNEQGSLVDIDVSLRVFEKAKQLHLLLQAAPQGARITKINEQSIQPVRQGDYVAYAQRVVAALQSNTATRKHVRLVLQSSAFKAAARTLPTEVAFVAPPQGGEGTAGQRVTLVLRRQSTTADWGFTVDDRLYWHAPPRRVLSEAAKAFVQDYGAHLRLLAVNGVEALHPTQVELLVSSAETVVLELLVMPSFAEPRRTASRGQTNTQRIKVSDDAEGSGDDTEVRGRKDKPQRTIEATSTAASDAKVEAAVAKFLQRHSDDAATTEEAPVAATMVVAMETPLVDAVDERPSPMVAAAAAAIAGAATTTETAEGEVKRKRGRPRKVGTLTDAATVAEMATMLVAMETPVVDAVGEPSSRMEAVAAGTAAAAEVAAEETKRKRGRPRKAVTEEVQPARKRGRPRKNPTEEEGALLDTTAHAEDDIPHGVNDASVQKVLAAFADDDGEKPRTSPTAISEKDEKAAPAAATTAESEAVAACVFDNKVELLRLTEEEMVLERPSTDLPWGLPIGRITDTAAAPQQLPLRLMSLPPAKAAAVKAHPFLAQFRKEPTTWFIAEVNGKAADNAEATLKSIAKLTRMTLRFLRK